MNKITITLIGILVLLTIGSAVFAFSTNSRLAGAVGEIGIAKSDLQAAESRIELLSQEKAELSEQVGQLRTLLDESKAKLVSTEAEVSEALAEVTGLEARLTDTESLLSDVNKKNAQMSRKIEFYECKDTLDMDYSSVMAASSRLMAYVDGLPSVDHTSTSFRNTLWNNADSKIYGISYMADDREAYSMQFLVFFNEFDLKEGVFYVDGQCWLDSPVK